MHILATIHLVRGLERQERRLQAPVLVQLQVPVCLLQVLQVLLELWVPDLQQQELLPVLQQHQVLSLSNRCSNNTR